MQMPKSRGKEIPGRRFDLMELVQQINRQELKFWLQPKSGDLMLDVMYLQQQIALETKPKIKGVFARASIVMAVATIEAVTNDALATIYELLTDAIPSECIGEPPWCYFVGRSTKRIARLLTKGTFAEKRDYLLAQIERVTGDAIDPKLLKDIERLRTYRNRIMHMSFQERPGKYKSVLAPKDVSHIAKQVRSTAEHYLDYLSYEFGELKLPIPTIRSPWFFDDDLKPELART
jgi:hypothetical protein